MTQTVTRYSISIDDGFVRESTTFRELSSNAKCILADILSITNGDLAKTASFLDRLLNETQAKIQLLADNDMSDEEFYVKLTKLKTEHRDTLDIIEKLYLSPDIHPEEENNTFYEYTENAVHQDNCYSGKEKCRNKQMLEEELDCEPSENNVCLSRENECRSLRSRESYLGDSRKKINENEINNGDHDNNSSYHDFSTSPASWKHHITVPEPFEMTKREEAIKKIRNIRSENKVSQLSAFDGDEDKYCCTQFKAKPIPSHVYLPLYEKLMEQNALKREAVRAYSKEILKATEKPFSFTVREKLKREKNDFSQDISKHYYIDKKPLQSKDNKSLDPLNLPLQLYERRFERMQEDLLLNEVKRQLRAQRLLQSASLPPGMEERQHRMNMRKLERKARDKRLNRINVLDLDDSEIGQKQYHHYHPAPDFKQLHWKSSKTLRRLWKPPPEPTRPKSFRLRTSERANSSDRQLSRNQNLKKDERKISQPILRQPAKCCVEPALSKSTFLRENYIRSSLAKADLDERKKEETECLKRLKQKEVLNTVKETLGGQIISPKKIIESITEERRRQLVQQDLARQAEYKRELNDIQQRVASKPLLITKQNQLIARKRAEAKFEASVRHAGLDLNELLEKNLKNNRQDQKLSPKANLSKVPVEVYDPKNHFGDLGDG
ncbi:unnamed protein product [Heterobilharzia americana]|nr:unnamed protein product [Heterobilharzia americana]